MSLQKASRAKKGTKVVWTATAFDVTVSVTTNDQDLTLYAQPIHTMREVGVALVDESGNMQANRRRDRKGNE